LKKKNNNSQNVETRKPWWIVGTFHDTPPTETKNHVKPENLNGPKQLKMRGKKQLVGTFFMFLSIDKKFHL